MTDTIARALAARAKGFTDKLFGGLVTSAAERTALQQALTAAGVTTPDPAARAAADALALKQAPLFDGSVVVLGDSIPANTVAYDTTANGSNTWQTKGWFTMLVARSGGRLRAVDIPGWPFTNTGITTTGWGELIVVNGGSGYSASTTATSDASTRGVAGSAISLTITNGVVTGATVTNPGTGYLGSSPVITITDLAGTGSGALILAQVAKAGEFAAGGIGSAQAMGYLPRILNGGSPIVRNVIVAIGTNDAPLGISLAQSKANIVAICRTLVAGGVRPIVMAVLERNATAGATAKRQAAALRRWQITTLASLAPGTVVIDVTPYIVDPLLGTEQLSNTDFPDGLHPASRGADAVAKAAWPQIAPLFIGSPSSVSSSSNGDGYDATYNPQGNLLAQTITGVGATATPDASGEAPWTGTRFTGLFLSRVAGGTGTGTIAASIEPRTDGRKGSYQTLSVAVTGARAGETYRVTWSSNGIANTLDVAPSVGGATLQVGDRIIGTLDELVMSNVSNLSGAKLKLVAANASSGYPITPTAASVHNGRTGTAAWGDNEEALLPAWAGDTLTLATREMVIPASTARVSMTMEFVVSAAGSASFTAKLYGAALRRLPQ